MWPSSAVARPAPAQQMPWPRHRRAQEPQMFNTARRGISRGGAHITLSLALHPTLSLSLSVCVSLSVSLCLCVCSSLCLSEVQLDNWVRILMCAAGGHRDLPHREEAGQLQAMWWGHSSVHDRGHKGDGQHHKRQASTRCSLRHPEFSMVSKVSQTRLSQSRSAGLCLQSLHMRKLSRSSTCQRTSWTARPARELQL